MTADIKWRNNNAIITPNLAIKSLASHGCVLMLRTQAKSQMIIMVLNLLDLSNYIIINKICAAFRPHKYMSGPLGPLENLSSLWLHKIYFFLTAKRFDFHSIYLPWDNLMLTVVFGKLKFSSFQSEHIQ